MPSEGFGLTVDPHQLRGIEINPRAAAIADLVLWIGYLQWHFRTYGNKMPAEPIIHAYHNIECRDAVLEYDRKEVVLDEHGQPVTRWDGRTMKVHPVTGEEVPDESARVPVCRYVNPRRAEWPKADYVVGNPPFIGNKRMRAVLADGYVDALREARDDVPNTSDYVMYWWDHAASQILGGEIQRFGFITTNSITQALNRKIIGKYLDAPKPLSILFAIPDHPWVDSSDGAAVRVAMTVCGSGATTGLLQKVVNEDKATQDRHALRFSYETGRIQPDLSIGAAVTKSYRLISNLNICQQGVKLVGDGFLVNQLDSATFRKSVGPVIKPFISNKDLVQRSRNLFVIDFFGLDEMEALELHPEAFQQVIDKVKDYRVQNRDPQRKRDWWLFGRSNERMRKSIFGLHRYIITPEVAKHRPFVFVPGNTIPDASLYVFGSDDAFMLGILSSYIHVKWALAAGGKMGKGNDPRYQNGPCFETFPFPNCSDENKARIRTLAESLDSHRKRQQALHSDLTLTNMYNVLEKLRSGEPLTEKEKVVHELGLVSILKQIHDDLDAAVFDAYGWPRNLSDEEILRRLVDLNRERAAEEARGIIRWLRPEFQNPEGAKAATQAALPIETEAEPATAETPTAPAKKQPWPKSLAEQAQAVRAALASSPGGMTPDQLAKTFLRARVDRVAELLETLVSLGQARELSDGRYVRA